MKSRRIVHNGRPHHVATSNSGGFSIKEAGTAMTAFLLMFTLLIAGVWTQFSASAAGAGSKGPKGGKKVPHTLEFWGDIVGSDTVDLNPDNPLNNVSLDSFQLDFIEFERGAPTCCTPDCDNFVDGWGFYDDNNSWMGPLGIKKTRQGGSVKWNVAFNEGTNNVGGSINLVVQGTPIETKSGDTTTLEFTNAVGLVSAFSSPDGANVDNYDRCLYFSISATKLP